jgi:hypothetical protein
LGRSFELVAVGSGAKGGEDGFVVFVHRHHEDVDVLCLLDDLACCLDPVQVGHVEVHYDDVRGERACQLDGLLAACRLADDLGVGDRFEEGAEAAAEEWVVVGDQDADRLAQPASCSGA